MFLEGQRPGLGHPESTIRWWSSQFSGADEEQGCSYPDVTREAWIITVQVIIHESGRLNEEQLVRFTSPGPCNWAVLSGHSSLHLLDTPIPLPQVTNGPNTLSWQPGELGTANGRRFTTGKGLCKLGMHDISWTYCQSPRHLRWTNPFPRFSSATFSTASAVKREYVAGAEPNLNQS